MSYKTKPYFLIPVIPNYFKSYNVDVDRNLHVNRLSGESETIPLEGLASKILKGKGLKFIINLMVGSGDLELTGSAVGRGLTIKNVYNVKQFKDVIDGNLKIHTEDSSMKNRKEFMEKDLGDKIIYYPHIPYTIDELLKSQRKRNLLKKEAVYINLKKIGDWVFQGDVIAKYGDIEITAISDGKIVFISSAQPGKHEWPERPDNTIVYPKEINKEDCYCVGIRTLDEYPFNGTYNEMAPSLQVRYLYNHGKAIFDNKGLDTFYAIADNAHVGESAIYIPKHLKNSKELKKYWRLINAGRAYIEKIDSKEEI